MLKYCASAPSLYIDSLIVINSYYAPNKEVSLKQPSSGHGMNTQFMDTDSHKFIHTIVAIHVKRSARLMVGITLSV